MGGVGKDLHASGRVDDNGRHACSDSAARIVSSTAAASKDSSSGSGSMESSSMSKRNAAGEQSSSGFTTTTRPCNSSDASCHRKGCYSRLATGPDPTDRARPSSDPSRSSVVGNVVGRFGRHDRESVASRLGRTAARRHIRAAGIWVVVIEQLLAPAGRERVVR